MDRKGFLTLLLVSAFSLLTLFVAIKFDILVLVLGFAIILIAGALFLSLLLQKPGSLLLVYVLLLPINSLVLAALFKFSGSRFLIVAFQPWKELLAILIFLFVFFGLMHRMRISSRLHKLDLLIVFFLLLNILYLVLPIGPDLTARAYGLRGSAFFLLIYLLGRMVPLETRLQRIIIVTLVAIGALGGLLAILEKALPPTWPADLLGYPAYLLEFFNQEPRGHYGLTWTFETASGLRRSSAFFANPLELASSTLLTGVAALYVMFSYRPRTVGRWLAAICWLLIVVSLLLSVSRASIVAFGIQTVVAALWLGRTRFALLVIGISCIGMLVVLVLVGPPLTNLIAETITFQNPSSQGHLANWLEGFNTLIEQPLGIGLGMSGQVGERFAERVGGENQFIITGVQLGVVGLALYFIIQLGAIWYSLRAYHTVDGSAQGLAFIAAAGKFGLLVPAFTANIDTYLFVTFVTWWLVGFSIQQLIRHSAQDSDETLPAVIPGSV